MIAVAPSLPINLLTGQIMSIGTALVQEERPQRYDFEETWRGWMAAVFPEFTEFAEHHADFWDWVWSIEPNVRPKPFVAIWPRGGAKSSSAELAVVALLARGIRIYGLYISGTQEQAEKHLDAIAALMLSPGIAMYYPELANRAVNKYGSSQGWRRNRLTTTAGAVVDAIGLRTGTRGVKFEQQRPDFFVLDDVDELGDSAEATEKKIATFTHTLLPAGSASVATLAIQNMILADGLFARLAPNAAKPATFLADRVVSGPIPAVQYLEYEERDGRVTITGGTATWAGQSIETCQAQVNDWGIGAFLAEAQHLPRALGAKIFDPAWWSTAHTRYDPRDRALLNQTVARFMSWDTAESVSDSSAYTALVVGDIIPYRGSHAVLIREVWRKRVLQPELVRSIEAFARRYDMHLPDAAVPNTGIWIEYASSGRAAYQSLTDNAPAWLRDRIRPFTPKTSKDDRLVHAAGYCRAGRVWLPIDTDGAPWLGVFTDELYSVPNSVYRDITDAFSQLVIVSRHWLAEPALQEAA